MIRFGFCVTLASTLLLTGCIFGSSDSRNSQQLYQPPYLHLEAGSEIQTRDGLYKPQVAEQWIALWKYQQLEEDNLSLLNTVRQLQAERDVLNLNK